MINRDGYVLRKPHYFDVLTGSDSLVEYDLKKCNAAISGFWD